MHPYIHPRQLNKHVHAYTQGACMQTSMHACIHAYIYICTYVHTYTCITPTYVQPNYMRTYNTVKRIYGVRMRAAPFCCASCSEHCQQDLFSCLLPTSLGAPICACPHKHGSCSSLSSGSRVVRLYGSCISCLAFRSKKGAHGHLLDNSCGPLPAVRW